MWDVPHFVERRRRKVEKTWTISIVARATISKNTLIGLRELPLRS